MEWQKHTGTERPAELAAAQIVEWRVNDGHILKDPAGNLNWAAELYSGSVMHYRPALDPDGIPYCSAEGLESDMEWVITQPDGRVIQHTLKPFWSGVFGWMHDNRCETLPAPETHRKPGDPADSLMRVWRD